MAADNYTQAEHLARRALPVADPAGALVLAALAQARATLALVDAMRAGAIPPGKTLVDRCRVCESAHGRQCLAAEGHDGDHDYGNDTRTEQAGGTR